MRAETRESVQIHFLARRCGKTSTPRIGSFLLLRAPMAITEEIQVMTQQALEAINAHPLISALVFLTVFAALVQGWQIWRGS